MTKVNRWQQNKEVLLIISSSGTIYIASEDKEFKLRRVIELSSLRALSLINHEKQQGPCSFILHHMASWDSLLSCATVEIRTAIYKVVKYLYWKNYKANLPVYLVPEALKHKVVMKKDKISNKKARYQLPSKLRAVDHDIYPEETSAAEVQKMYAQKYG